MKKLALIVALAWCAPLWAAPPAGFEQRVESLRTSIGVPGVSISIVEDGKVTLARGFGVKRLGATDPVGADTLFSTGSTGKAVTVAALATLVDQGKIKWDDKVIDHLTWFQMYDPWVTREMTIRDLLVHRSGLGLGAGDLLFVPDAKYSRAESVRRLRYIKPATSFRSGYAYDNVLYMVAGQLIEAVTGKTFEKYVAEDLFKPAGMFQSTSDDDVRFTRPDRAQPHARLGGAFRGLGELQLLDERAGLGRNAAPAGGLSVSANDMARWLLIQLARGKLPEGNGRLFSEAASREMWTPVVFQPVDELPPALAAAVPKFNTYALGWDVQDYKGEKIIWHGGFVWGFKTAVVLIPDRNVGFSIAINSEDGVLVNGLMYELLDHYLGQPRGDWPAAWMGYRKELVAKATKAFTTQAAARAKVGPSLPPTRYAGRYSDPWYGEIVIGADRGRLNIDFQHTPGMKGRLEHWQYDTFITRFEDGTIEPALVTFGLDADGKVERITMKAASPAADFSYDYHDLLFTPVAGRQ
jgi:CubicO group peptidase (beta-lactamase class C family)